MSAAAAGLKRLHELHLRLQELQQQLEHGPRQVKARQQILASKQAEIDAFKAELKQARMLADQKNLQLKTNESKIADLKAKLNQATSNREFDIIRSQIDADMMANSVLEDEILEVLEKVDQIQQKIEQGRRRGGPVGRRRPPRRPGSRNDRSQAPRPGDRNRNGPARSGKDSPVGGRSKSTAGWCRPTGPGPWRRSKTTPARPAIEILSANSLVELNTGKFIFCRSCGRLLYRPEKPTDAAPVPSGAGCVAFVNIAVAPMFPAVSTPLGLSTLRTFLWRMRLSCARTRLQVARSADWSPASAGPDLARPLRCVVFVDIDGPAICDRTTEPSPTPSGHSA